ncbi:MAG: hypothetical protein V3U60_03235 [Gammaproteobacteria bacterium]
MTGYATRIGLAVALGLSVGLCATTQGPPIEPETIELRAEARIAFESGLRTVGVRRGPQGNYYVLNMRDRVVWVYDSDFARLGSIGSIGKADADLESPWEFAITQDGKVVIADYGASKVKVFLPNGTLASSFAFPCPWAVATLSTGEILVSGFPQKQLVHVYTEEGTLLRTFGDPVQIDDHSARNSVLNVGKLVVDSADNIYYLFYFLPEPTIRKYNYEGELLAELHPDGERIREIARNAKRTLERNQREGGLGASSVLDTLAVDEETGDLWVGCTYVLYRLSSDGETKGIYTFKRKDNTIIDVDHILLEKDTLIITSSLFGVYRCPRPTTVHSKAAWRY